jgi:hypothetical protein
MLYLCYLVLVELSVYEDFLVITENIYYKSAKIVQIL